MTSNDQHVCSPKPRLRTVFSKFAFTTTAREKSVLRRIPCNIKALEKNSVSDSLSR